MIISNIEGQLIEDTAEEHRTTPPSFWFIAQTDYGRQLKVVLVPKDGNIFLKTAFDAKISHVQLYEDLNKNTHNYYNYYIGNRFPGYHFTLNIN